MPEDFKKQYTRTAAFYTGQPWAIIPEKLAEIQAFFIRKAASLGIGEPVAFDDEPLQAAAKKPTSSMRGDIAVLQIFGTISKRMDMFSSISGGSSVENITKDFRMALDNPSVKAIVLNIDSPGGTVTGVPELAEEIRAGRDKKWIVAVANDLAASAAYWLASQASEFVVTPSGSVGSIGVYTMHEDYTKMLENEGVKTTIIRAGKNKIAANPYEPLTEEARAKLQESVDYYYSMFIKAVAHGREVTADVVRKDFGQGNMFNANDAKAAGMVDKVDTLDGVLTRLGAKPGGKTVALARAEIDLAEVAG